MIWKKKTLLRLLKIRQISIYFQLGSSAYTFLECGHLLAKGLAKEKQLLWHKTVLLHQGNQTTKLSVWFLRPVRTALSRARCSSIANRTPGTSERKMLAFYKEEWMFMSTVIFLFDGLVQQLPLRKQLILIKHNPGTISMCYWSGKTHKHAPQCLL